MITLSRDESTRIEADLELAQNYLTKMCKGEKLYLSIPAQPNDYDNVFQRVLDYTKRNMLATQFLRVIGEIKVAPSDYSTKPILFVSPEMFQSLIDVKLNKDQKVKTS